jgi:hypothetical protein
LADEFGKYHLANFELATWMMYAVDRRDVRKSGRISRRPAVRLSLSYASDCTNHGPFPAIVVCAFITSSSSTPKAPGRHSIATATKSEMISGVGSNESQSSRLFLDEKPLDKKLSGFFLGVATRPASCCWHLGSWAREIIVVEIHLVSSGAPQEFSGLPHSAELSLLEVIARFLIQNPIRRVHHY